MHNNDNHKKSPGLLSLCLGFTFLLAMLCFAGAGLWYLVLVFVPGDTERVANLVYAGLTFSGLSWLMVKAAP